MNSIWIGRWKIRNIGTTRNTMFSQISQSHKQYFARSPNGFGQWQRLASLFFGFFSAAISPKEIYILPRLSVHRTTMQVNTGNGWDKFQSCWPKIPKWQTFRGKKEKNWSGSQLRLLAARFSNVSHCASVWPTFSNVRCLNYYEILLLVMGFISLEMLIVSWGVPSRWIDFCVCVCVW